MMRNLYISWGQHPDVEEARTLAMFFHRVQRRVEALTAGHN